jgi:hypothetical protein
MKLSYRFLTTSVKMAVFWDVAAYNLLDIDSRFRGVW